MHLSGALMAQRVSAQSCLLDSLGTIYYFKCPSSEWHIGGWNELMPLIFSLGKNHLGTLKKIQNIIKHK